MFLVSSLFFFVLVPCGRLSWLLVSFWAHVNIVLHIITDFTNFARAVSISTHISNLSTTSWTNTNITTAWHVTSLNHEKVPSEARHNTVDCLLSEQLQQVIPTIRKLPCFDAVGRATEGHLAYKKPDPQIQQVAFARRSLT